MLVSIIPPAPSAAAISLVVAAKRGDNDTVDRAITSGAAVNAQDPTDGSTGLHHAAQYAKTATVRHLLTEHGADATLRMTDGTLPIHCASLIGCVDTAELLKDLNGVDATKDGGTTPLLIAAGNGYTPLVDKLIEWGADVCKTDLFNNTPLHVSIINGRHDATKSLLEAGAKMDAVNVAGHAPITIAAALSLQDPRLLKLLNDKTLRNEQDSLAEQLDTAKDKIKKLEKKSRSRLGWIKRLLTYVAFTLLLAFAWWTTRSNPTKTADKLRLRDDDNQVHFFQDNEKEDDDNEVFFQDDDDKEVSLYPQWAMYVYGTALLAFLLCVSIAWYGAKFPITKWWTRNNKSD